MAAMNYAEIKKLADDALEEASRSHSRDFRLGGCREAYGRLSRAHQLLKLCNLQQTLKSQPQLDGPPDEIATKRRSIEIQMVVTCLFRIITAVDCIHRDAPQILKYFLGLGRRSVLSELLDALRQFHSLASKPDTQEFARGVLKDQQPTFTAAIDFLRQQGCTSEAALYESLIRSAVTEQSAIQQPHDS
jgi:hypothetical protein